MSYHLDALSTTSNSSRPRDQEMRELGQVYAIDDDQYHPDAVSQWAKQFDVLMPVKLKEVCNLFERLSTELG